MSARDMLRASFARLVEHEFVNADIAQRQNQCRDNQDIQPFALARADGLGAIDVFIPFYALGRQLKQPGNNQCEGRSGSNHHQQGFHHPIRCSKRFQNQVQNLCQQQGRQHDRPVEASRQLIATEIKTP
jgi:hypothetical protein